MKTKLSPEQIDINLKIEALRIIKEQKKKEYLQLSEDVYKIDIEIRELRQKLPTLAPIPEKKYLPIKKKETEEEKIIRLTKELEAIRNRRLK